MANIANKELELDFYKLDSQKFYIGLAIALACQLLLISVPIAFGIDMNLYKAWAIDIVRQGLGNFYNYSNCDYPPVYLYVLWAIGKIYQFFDPHFSHADGWLFTALIKIPPVLANIGSAFLIAQILRPYSDKGYKLGLLYAFNPLMWFVSGVWGQIDGVMTLLMLLAFYLIEQNHVIRAGLLIAVMVIVKPQGLFIAPFLLLSQWFRQAWWKWGAIAMGSLGLIWLAALPFYGFTEYGITTPFLYLYKRLQRTADYYNFASVNAFNFWGWANWERDYATFWGISYKVIGLVSLVILLGWLGIFLYQQRDQQEQLATHSLALATMLIGFFMLPTRMHERYMLYSLAFLAIAIALIPTVKWLYWGFTITNSINVAYVYFRYNYEAWYVTVPNLWIQSLTLAISAVNGILFLVLIFQMTHWQSTSKISNPIES